MNHFLGWVKDFFIADLSLRYIPRDDKTRDEIWNLLKDGFIAEVEGKTARAQTRLLGRRHAVRELVAQAPLALAITPCEVLKRDAPQPVVAH